MKMMNDMMAMNGDLMPMGMEMSDQTMDMNTVMYPEVTGEENPKNENKKDTMQGMNMGTETSDIVTLNYGMLRAQPIKQLCHLGPVKELKFDLTGEYEPLCMTLDK
jgi:hypothetical protein